MSDTVFASLPRFDVPGEMSGLSMLKSFVAGVSVASVSVDGVSGEDAAIDQSDEPPETEAETDCAPPPEQADETAPVEAALVLLRDAANKLDQETEDRVVSLVQAMASKLFPELSRLFLAEEIGRHLPKCVPASVPAIEIRAEPELAKNLRQVIARTDSLFARCTVVPAETAQDDRVDVSWQSGGLTFDFSGLLSACLAQIVSHQKNIAE